MRVHLEPEYFLFHLGQVQPRLFLHLPLALDEQSKAQDHQGAEDDYKDQKAGCLGEMLVDCKPDGLRFFIPHTMHITDINIKRILTWR